MKEIPEWFRKIYTEYLRKEHSKQKYKKYYRIHLYFVWIRVPWCIFKKAYYARKIVSAQWSIHKLKTIEFGRS